MIEDAIYKFLVDSNLVGDHVYQQIIDSTKENFISNPVISFFLAPSLGSSNIPSYLDNFQIDVRSNNLTESKNISNQIYSLFHKFGSGKMPLDTGYTSKVITVSNFSKLGTRFEGDQLDIAVTTITIGFKYSGSYI